MDFLPPLRYAGGGGDVGRSTTNMPWIYLKSSYLHKQSTKRNNMDPIHYEKIADKLMQFRGKLPKEYHLSTIYAQKRTKEMKELIDNLLNELEQYARADDMGWIR